MPFNIASSKKISFSALMQRLLGLLSPKEKDIIERRYCLKKPKKDTLDVIGSEYNITRERVRQIEVGALKKLARIARDSELRNLHETAHKILEAHGGVMVEDQFLSRLLKVLHIKKLTAEIDVNALKLALLVSDRMKYQHKNQFFRPFWYFKVFSISEIKEALKKVKQVLKKEHRVMSVEELVEKTKTLFSPQTLEAILETDWRLKRTESGWGLAEWPDINPKSIKDKITIILKEAGEPLHFVDIINRIMERFSDKKKTTRQAVHNELIRHPEFVLVGRGMYALKEWGLPAGTVCDLIIEVLQEHGGPMKRQDIIQKVLEYRPNIQKGTISLNLQKHPFFERVGRAVYEYRPELDTRRRKKKHALESTFFLRKQKQEPLPDKEKE